MRVFSRSTLIEFWKKHRDAEPALRLWFSQVEKASWRGPADVRATFGTADFVANNRVIFDIKGNTYRLIAHVRYHSAWSSFDSSERTQSMTRSMPLQFRRSS